MKILVRIKQEGSNDIRVHANSLRQLWGKFPPGVAEGSTFSAKVRYSKHRVRDIWEDLVWVENELPWTSDLEQFKADLKQTANANEVKFQLEYWGLKE